LGISYEDAKRLGPEVAALHPDAPGNRKHVEAVRLAAETRRNRPRVTGLNVLGQNKGEARLDGHLEDVKRQGGIRDFRWEPFKLRIAARTWLKIDFVVLPLASFVNTTPPLILIDYKGGPWEDDAAVKMKVAAERFAWLGSLWVVRTCRQGWEWWPVSPRSGLGKPVIGDPWL
jgi:hypothetical protein